MNVIRYYINVKRMCMCRFVCTVFKNDVIMYCMNTKRVWMCQLVSAVLKKNVIIVSCDNLWGWSRILWANDGN